jgi:hypothetical protein
MTSCEGYLANFSEPLHPNFREFLFHALQCIREEASMGASHVGTSLGAWGSLLTINSGQPLRVDGYNPVGFQHAAETRSEVHAPFYALG